MRMLRSCLIVVGLVPGLAAAQNAPVPEWPLDSGSKVRVLQTMQRLLHLGLRPGRNCCHRRCAGWDRRCPDRNVGRALVGADTWVPVAVPHS